MKAHIITGNNIDVLRTYPDNHFDSIVTDPPYGIDFLGKTWDANTGALETYQQCLRVLKPGGYLLAFSAARTYHHLAVTVEQAGFEIRDQIMWIYSSGFPKSQDVGKNIQRSIGVTDKKQVVCTDPVAQQWEGWGTCLKPAHEPIVMARKPTKLSFAENVQLWGMGALNIDAGRVPFADATDIPSGGENGWSRVGFSEQPVEKYRDQKKKKKTDAEIYLDNKRGPMERSTAQDGDGIGMFEGGVGYKTIKRKVTVEEDLPAGRFPSNVIGEIEEPYQKYFYCPKISRSERHIGFDLDQVPVNEFNDPGKVQDHPLWDESIGTSVSRLQDKIRKSNPPGNNHPTVKPIELMKYLIKLVTPAGGHVLDPFNGSGSTGCAAVELNYEYTGIELDPKYADIAQKRIQTWYEQTHTTTFGELFE